VELFHQALAVWIAGELALRGRQHLLEPDNDQVLDKMGAGLGRTTAGLLAMEAHHRVADLGFDLTFGA
jgi:hypothetical protein